jgi:hypothetical protein
MDILFFPAELSETESSGFAHSCAPPRAGEPWSQFRKFSSIFGGEPVAKASEICFSA